MRFVLACLVALGFVIGSAAVALPAAAADAGFVVALQQPPTGELNVDITTDGGGAWYTSPLWIAIGVIGLLLLIVIVAMAARGGGTTVIRD